MLYGTEYSREQGLFLLLSKLSSVHQMQFGKLSLYLFFVISALNQMNQRETGSIYLLFPGILHNLCFDMAPRYILLADPNIANLWNSANDRQLMYSHWQDASGYFHVSH